LPRAPESKAGAKDLAGFIDAPDMEARKKMSTDHPSYTTLISSLLFYNQFINARIIADSSALFHA
jgi:hypothetical protein